MNIYTVTYKELVYNDGYNGALGTYSTLDKAQKAVESHIQDQIDEELKDYTEDQKIEYAEEYEALKNGVLHGRSWDGNWSHCEAIDQWTRYHMDEEGFGEEYTICLHNLDDDEE